MAPNRLESPLVEEASAIIANKPTSNKPASDGTYGKYYPRDPSTLNLESNFGPMEPKSIGYLQPTSIDTPIEIMHERYQRDGYLFVS